MKSHTFDIINRKTIPKYIIIAAAVFISWFPALYIPFINDDYQILGYNSGKTFLSIFKSFWTPDVSYYYWRPLGNIIHPAILLIAGFEPFPFRFVSLLIYIFCCIVILYVSTKINLNIKLSLFLTVFFCILPSHEFQIAWIADQGESLLAALLLLSFISYYFVLEGKSNSKRTLIYFLLFFIASLLVKELAFIGFLIPLVAYLAKTEKGGIKFKEILKHIFIAFGVLCLVLLYRFIVIGGSPFNSPNFSNSGPITWIKNYFIYIPLAFLPPKVLEIVYDNLHNWLVAISLFLASILAIYLILYAFKRLDKDKKNLVLAGFAWFTIFIIPALPKLMRWYVFTASIGLIWSLACILEFYWEKLNVRKVVKVIAIPIFIFLIIYDFLLMQQWVSAGNKFKESLASLEKIKSEIKTDSVFVWCVPDKLNRVPMMKLAVQQSIQWILHNKDLEIFSPLRAELTNDTSKILLKQNSDSVYIFHLYGGRFLPIGGKSEAVIEKEFISFNNQNVEFNINTYIKNSEPQSIAVVKLKPHYLHLTQLYYNGNIFEKIK